MPVLSNDFMAIPEGEHFVLFFKGEEYCRVDSLAEAQKEITEYLESHPDPPRI